MIACFSSKKEDLNKNKKREDTSKRKNERNTTSSSLFFFSIYHLKYSYFQTVLLRYHHKKHIISIHLSIQREESVLLDRIVVSASTTIW